MSYNISEWKVKKLKDLKIPLKSFFTHARDDWHPDKEFDENGVCTLTIGKSYLSGKTKNGIIHVDKIDFSGECSGTAIEYILEPALNDSKGILTVSCVWEDGDTINKLIVKDGKVKWKKINI